MPDIDPKLLWGFCSLLIVVLGFFIRSWMNRLSQDFASLVKKMKCKQDVAVCNERFPAIRDDLSKFHKHKHVLNCNKDETGGVIIP